MSKRYDVVVIGGGPGGYTAASVAADLGAKVALIEASNVGGTCLNHGCIPTKTLLRSAELYSIIREAGSFGIKGTDSATVDFAVIAKRKTQVVVALRQGLVSKLKKKMEIISGLAQIETANTVMITSTDQKQLAYGEKLIIATGSIPISIPELSGTGVLDTNAALDLDSLPSDLLIVGGGVIGVEFASIFAKLGTKVRIVEQLDSILPNEDSSIVKTLEKSLRGDGVEIFCNTSLKKIATNSMQRCQVDLLQASKQFQLEVGRVLIAVGRKPNTDGLGAERIGLSLNHRGAINVNQKLETNIPGIYAVGDAIGRIMLAHVAMLEGEVAALNALGYSRQMDYRTVPRCIYSLPEIAAVGLTEAEARQHSLEIEVIQSHFSANSKAALGGEKQGFLKLIYERKFGEILGVHIIGPHATELIAEAVLAINLEGTVDDLATTLHAHPSLAEIYKEAVGIGRKQGLGISFK